jgi:hypothetical protein
MCQPHRRHTIKKFEGTQEELDVLHNDPRFMQTCGTSKIGWNGNEPIVLSARDFEAFIKEIENPTPLKPIVLENIRAHRKVGCGEGYIDRLRTYKPIYVSQEEWDASVDDEERCGL